MILTEFLHSYLAAYLIWIGLTLGAFAVLMIHGLTGGDWGKTVRPVLIPVLQTLPLMAVLFIPIYLNLKQLYPWAHGEELSGNKILYLNSHFFLVRTVIYFLIWAALAYAIQYFKSYRNLLSGLGLVFYGLTVTFASIDWAMSLEPEWYSTIYGLMFMIGQVLSAFAFSICALYFLNLHPASAHGHHPDPLHDLGNLLLAFVMLWAYLCFCQFFIIWSGNLPEEIVWYQIRLKGGWQCISILLLVFHFFLPFFLLLARNSKRKAAALTKIAIMIFFMRFMDGIWLVEPAFHPAHIQIPWIDALVMLGMGGIWLTYFKWRFTVFSKSEKVLAA